MSQQELEEQKGQEQKETIKKEAEGLFKSIKTFMVDLLDFRGDTDRDNTIEAIKNDIPFKGATAWILIFAIFIAPYMTSINMAPPMPPPMHSVAMACFAPSLLAA